MSDSMMRSAIKLKLHVSICLRQSDVHTFALFYLGRVDWISSFAIR